MTRRRVLLAGVAMALGCRSALAGRQSSSPGPDRPAQRTCPPRRNAVVNDPVALAAEAARRILAGLTPDRPYVVLLQTGDGARAKAAGEALRAALACDQRIALAEVVREHRAPAADPDRPQQHVNVVADIVRPPPALVVRVSESGPVLYIAARLPGADPLGPPDDGWLWVMQDP